MYVEGDLKCILTIKQVTTTLEKISRFVKIKYFPSSGRQIEVEGMISININRRNVSETRMDMVNDTL